MMRLKDDGTVRFTSMPWSGSPLYYLTMDSLRELPTTGYLATGRSTLDAHPQTTFLAQDDVAGAPMWLEQYRLTSSDPGYESAASFPNLALTDDGGALVVSHVRNQGAAEASLWLMKTYARDGTVGFESGKGTASAGSQEQADCPIAWATWEPSLQAFSMTVTPRTATSTLQAFDEQQQ